MRADPVFLVAILFCAAAAGAPPAAVVHAPSVVSAGRLAVVDPAGSTGDRFCWVLVQRSGSQSIELAEPAPFVLLMPRTPGRVVLVLIASGTDAAGELVTASAAATITIRPPGPGPDPPAPDPDEPEPDPDDPPAPEPDVPATLAPAIRTAWQGLEDPDKRNRAAAIGAVFTAFAERAGEFETVHAYSKATADAYREQIGLAGYETWLPVFRAIEAELEPLDLDGPAAFAPCWRVIGRVLLELGKD